jgi:hypothetical protein
MEEGKRGSEEEEEEEEEEERFQPARSRGALGILRQLDE